VVTVLHVELTIGGGFLIEVCNG